MATDPHHRPRPTTPRIPIVENPSEEVLETYAKGIASPDGNPINIFATLAHHPKVLKRFTNYAGFFLNKGLLPAREREIVILRVGWNCRSVYEFGQHTLIGRRVGLTDTEITALTRDPSAHPWSQRDADLIAMCDELCGDDCVGDATWGRLAAEWNEAALVELVMVAGTYRLVSGFLNTMGVELDTGTPGWPVD
ncbi:MAG: carboxymuconolactone decarboxylase family protein [Actinomycetota bacterium]